MSKKPSTKSTAAKTAPTLVTFLLDRSGSMGTDKPTTIEAFNAYLQTLKDGDANDVLFSFLQFDTESLDKVCIAEPVKNVANLTNATYQPRGGTPLIDACVKTINAVEESLTKRDDKPKVVICFQTDGEENSSRQHTWEGLNALIAKKTAEGWQFNFMGAGINAYTQATRMGIQAESTTGYDRTNLHATKSAFASTAHNTMAFARGAAHNTSYLSSQRASFGDKFSPPPSGGLGDLNLNPNQPAVQNGQIQTPTPSNTPLKGAHASQAFGADLDLSS